VIVAVAAAGSAWSCTNSVAVSTGLTGTVLRGPVTPVCQVGVPCDAPFAASFEVRRNGQRVATFSSDAQGHFQVRLAPGQYLIVPAANAPLMNPSAQSKTADVGSEGLTAIELLFDTGIR
ncbi:MAG: hypothetical protein ACRENU_13410, partial [Gemmatimonadaceae bacterium]